MFCVYLGSSMYFNGFKAVSASVLSGELLFLDRYTANRMKGRAETYINNRGSLMSQNYAPVVKRVKCISPIEFYQDKELQTELFPQVLNQIILEL